MATYLGGHRIYPAQWVSATRWATEDRAGEPITTLWDPPSGGEPFGEEDARRYRGAMTLAWLDSVAPGLGYRTAGELMSSDRAGDALAVEANPGPVPESEDWPRSDVTDDLFDASAAIGAVQVRAAGREGQSANNQLLARLGGRLSESSVYGGPTSPLVPVQSQKVPHNGKYISALVTRFGVQPVRGKRDLPMVLERQDRAREGEEPAMLVGIPMSIDPFEARGANTWEDGAGIASDGDLAIFDLRRVHVEALG